MRDQGRQRARSGVLLCDMPCVAAGVFTTNRVKAAPVLYCRQVLSKAARRGPGCGGERGNANACTGARGLEDAAAMAARRGKRPRTRSRVGAGDVHRDNRASVAAGENPRRAGLGAGQFWRAVSRPPAVRRGDHDHRPGGENLALQSSQAENPVTIGAAAKGSGMIHPNMATMLAFLATDAQSPAGAAGSPAQGCFVHVQHGRVDGDRSPNDSVFVLASGACGAPWWRARRARAG